jgi:hypothetical protein
VECLKQNFIIFTKLPPCLFSTTLILTSRSGICFNELSKQNSLHVFPSTEVESLVNCISLHVFQYLKWNPITKCHICTSDIWIFRFLIVSWNHSVHQMVSRCYTKKPLLLLNGFKNDCLEAFIGQNGLQTTFSFVYILWYE